jgi:hypothetical protein
MNITAIDHFTAIEIASHVFLARNGQQNLAQGFNPGLVIRSAGALPVRRSSALASEGGKVAPEGVASTHTYGLLIDPSRPILCPFRAQRVKTLSPGLKPWAKFSYPFRAIGPTHV